MRIMPPQGSVERSVFAPAAMCQRSVMNANPKFIAAAAHVDDAAVKPLPNSRKVYVEGSRGDVRVPMREIVQSDTPASFGAERNAPVYFYDTSAPYTDHHVRIDIRQGLPALRGARLADSKLAELRFDLKRAPRRARVPRRVTQKHYARKGIVTPEMEYIAIRE